MGSWEFLRQNGIVTMSVELKRRRVWSIKVHLCHECKTTFKAAFSEINLNANFNFMQISLLQLRTNVF